MEIQLRACDTALPWSTCSLGSGVPTSVTTAFFLSFIVFGTMIILNLLIGVVVNSMGEVAQEQASELSVENRLAGMDRKLDDLQRLLHSAVNRRAS
jgi:hypothetical protein